MMILDVICRALMGSAGSSGVERPRSMIWASRLGSNRTERAHMTLSQSSARYIVIDDDYSFDSVMTGSRCDNSVAGLI